MEWTSGLRGVEILASLSIVEPLRDVVAVWPRASRAWHLLLLSYPRSLAPHSTARSPGNDSSLQQRF